MGNLDENLQTWTAHNWAESGEEWSKTWGGSANLWWGCLFLRLAGHLPAATIVEIAPGAGRFSQYLCAWTDRLILVDVTPRCIELCQQRFAGRANVETRLNDGRTLPGIDDRSVQLVFSFDSLVHVDLSILRAYCDEIRRVLAPGGVAFLHHSNFASFLDPETGKATIENLHWRDPGVSAAAVEKEAALAGLRVLVQEKVNWGGDDLIDAFTLLGRDDDHRDVAPRRLENPDFMREAISLAQIGATWTEGGLDFSTQLASRTTAPRASFWQRMKGNS
ncbi:MAG: class I SAM-dependent methyltransferase [Thermoanaerobaculia bacterium]